QKGRAMPAGIAMAVDATEGDVVVNGARLHYLEAGHRPGPGDRGALPVVVVPGLMGHARGWDVLTAPLAQERRVIAIEQRGHGRSDWAPTYTIPDFVADLVGLLRATNVDRVALVGHSLGGLVAARCAAEHPGLVRRLVMVDIGPDSLETTWAHEELP